MSSSSSYHPPHLHHVNLHSHGKRPFEECGGYDSDPDTPMSLSQPTTSGTSSSNHNRRFPSTSSSTTPPNPEARNKRARSTSSSNTDDSTSSNISSSTGYNTAQSSSRSDLLSDGQSVLSANAVDCPIPPTSPSPPFVSTQDVPMSDLHIPIVPPQPQRAHTPTPHSPEDTLRNSLQRFAEFDRHIAALRTSLAVSRSPPLPPVGSVAGDASTGDHWNSNLPSFLSSRSAGAPSTTDPDSSTVECESPNSLSTLAPSYDSIPVTVTTSTASGSTSASFLPSYSNIPRYPPYPSYRPSVTNTSSHATHGRAGDAISSISVPLVMRPSSSENPAQTRMSANVSTPIQVSGSSVTSSLLTRPVNRSLSPNPEPQTSSSLSTLAVDDVLSCYRTPLNDTSPDDPHGGRAESVSRDGFGPSPEHEDLSTRFLDRLGSSSPTRVNARVRVIREHSLEREPVPSVFDVFNLNEPSQNRNRSSGREPASAHYSSITDSTLPALHEPQILNTSLVSTGHVRPQESRQDLNTRVHSSWSSIPSSNSLMSESASERRNALALERFRERLRPSNFDAENDDRERDGSRGRENVGVTVLPNSGAESGLGVGSSSRVPHPRTSQLTNRPEPLASSSPQRSFSELFPEPGREHERELERERDQNREREREPVWEWERERERERERLRERLDQDRRGGAAVSYGLRSTSPAREELNRRPTLSLSGPSRPRGGLRTEAGSATTATSSSVRNNGQYSYSNLNLSSFQAGLFRDSLRRNAEVDQGPSSVNGGTNAGRGGRMPPQPSPLSGMTSDSSSQLGVDLDDSGSDMDLDIPASYRPRSPSPEWSRPHPYAGRTPPPDYIPPRNFSLQPRFSLLRRGSMNLESHSRSQPFNRTASTVNRPASSIMPEAARQIPYGISQPESNNRSAERPDRDRFSRIFDSLHRSNDDGRRNSSFPPTPSQQPYHLHYPPHNPTHALAPGPDAFPQNTNSEIGGARNVGGNSANENRRSSLGLGGSIRSRLARFANPHSSSNASDASPSRQRSPSLPVGAHPQSVEPHRRGSSIFSSGHVIDHQSRPESRRTSNGLPHAHWPMNPSSTEHPPTRDVLWRSSSGPRSSFPTASTLGATVPNPRTIDTFPEASNRGEERSRLRTLRQRLQLDRGGEALRFRSGMLRSAFGRRNMGDYVPDELFDDSYEALLSLSTILGEVRSKATPEDVISSLPTGTFKEWRTVDSETRCPICLDDYEPSDVLTKLLECPHWLHKNCLEQWLRTANTCPVCRVEVRASPKAGPARRRQLNRDSFGAEANHDPSSSASGNGPSIRPSHTDLQTSNGRPASFAAMVFDRLMNEGREIPGDQWSSPSPQVPQPDQELVGFARGMILHSLRAQQHHSHQHPHLHDSRVLVRLSPPRELPYHLRVVPPESGVPSRMPRMQRTDGPGSRPHILMPLRGQDSDSSISSSSSLSILVDELDRMNGRPTMDNTELGSSFFNTPSSTRRAETSFSPAPSSSAPFMSTSVPSSSQQQPTQSSADSRAPTMPAANLTEPAMTRSAASSRMYDVLFNAPTAPRASPSTFASQPPPSSSSSIPPRHSSTSRRLPIDTDADASFNEFLEWNVRRRSAPYPYDLEPEDEPSSNSSW